MKPSSIVCTSFVALAVLAMTTDAAFASKAEFIEAVAKRAKACMENGGIISRDNSRRMICVKHGTSPIDINDPKAVAACVYDGGGTVFRDRDGRTICTKTVQWFDFDKSNWSDFDKSN